MQSKHRKNRKDLKGGKDTAKSKTGIAAEKSKTGSTTAKPKAGNTAAKSKQRPGRKSVTAAVGAVFVLLLLIIVICWQSCGDSQEGEFSSQNSESSTQDGGDEEQESGSSDGSNADDTETATEGSDDTEDSIVSNLGQTDEDTDTETVSGTSDTENAGNTEAAEATETTEAETTEQATASEIQNTSSLTLSSVYTSSILNPDSGYEYAEEVASLEVTNSSDRYLVSATLTGIISDGTEVSFAVYDLPAGATAEIFDTGNQTLADGTYCTSLVCTSEKYLDAEEDVLLSGSVTVTASGSDAVLTNTGSKTLNNVTIVYHCDMAGQYLGGISYTITIDSLAAGKSFTLSDSTLMGEVAVVRIYQ